MKSEKISLIEKSREAILSAVQVFNNPLTTFKSETFIVLAMIAWMYLLHAYYRKKNINYRYSRKNRKKKKYIKNPDGSFRYWDLSKCLDNKLCPLDGHTKNNLFFLIGLRNHIEHHKPSGLDTYLSARYQACTLNFNHYLKTLFGDKYTLENSLALALQFAQLDYNQIETIRNREKYIPKEIMSYIAGFDNRLNEAQISNERYGYRVLFIKNLARKQNQADRVIEFIDPKSDLAKIRSKEYWVKDETEKPKFIASEVVQKIKEAGFNDFGMYQHTQFWKKHNGKDPNKRLGVFVTKYWYWYQKWIDFILKELKI